LDLADVVLLVVGLFWIGGVDVDVVLGCGFVIIVFKSEERGMALTPHERPSGIRNAEKQKQQTEGSIPVARTDAAMTRVL
jgi:hypothetical protein